jgi:hypothetical protein
LPLPEISADRLPERHILLSCGGFVCDFPLVALVFLAAAFFFRYVVTELLDTDLQRLLESQTLDGRFIQYFVYQILVTIPRSTQQTGSNS